MLSDVPGEICETDIARVFFVAVLREYEATADRFGTRVYEEKRISAGSRLDQSVRDDDRLMTRHENSTVSCLEIDKHILGDAGLGSL